MSDLAIGLAAIVVLGVGTQWLAARLKVPVILLLLVAGVAAGSSSLVDPEHLFGETLFPAVSLGVGILLFEGGLGLRFDRLGQGGTAVLRLVTIGAAVTWIVASAAAWWLLDLSRGEAVLLGAILIVSGPTVVLPLLAQLRLRDPVDAVARWEGIVIDPIGAATAVVVVEVLLGDEAHVVGSAGLVLLSLLVGVAVGAAGAAVLTFVLARHHVPDNLTNGVTLATVVLAFTVANELRAEAGLFAAVVMGVALANQRKVSLRPIEEFEQSLGLLVLGALFVVLGASLELGALGEYLLPALGLLAVLVLVARPLTVLVSTIGTRLSGRDRLFLMAMLPRGIVAAAVSALFALELEREGAPMDELVPVVYVVIFGTVVFSSVVTRPLSKRLRLAKPDPVGITIVGGDEMARELARELMANDIPVIAIPGDEAEAAQLVDAGVLTYHGQLDSESLDHALHGVGVRQAIVLSQSERLTSYTVPRLAELLGRANVFYLPAGHEAAAPGTREATVLARHPVHPDLTHDELAERFDRGEGFRTFDRERLSTTGDGHSEVVPIIAISQQGEAQVVDAGAGAPLPSCERFIGLAPV